MNAPASGHGSLWAGMGWIVLTAVLWSFLGCLGKYCLAAGMTPAQCAFWRAAFGGGAFLLHGLATGRLGLPGRRELLFMLFGAWGIGCYYLLMQWTIRLSGAAMDIILQYTAPFWVALFAWRLYGERLTPAGLTALAVAAAGTLCVCLSGGSLPEGFSPLGLATGLASGLCYATHFPFIRYWQARCPAPVLFSWMLAGGALALLPALAAGPALRLDFAPPVWGASAASGLVCTWLAFICYGEALRRISLVQAAVASELEPVLSLVWLWLVFGERFSPLGWVGSACIVLAVLCLTLSRAER